jgi:hypothetical protein
MHRSARSDKLLTTGEQNNCLVLESLGNDNIPEVNILYISDLLASARERRPGSGLVVRWMALGQARAQLGVKAAGGRWRGAVARGAPGTLGLGRSESRGPLARTLVDGL